MQRYIVVFLWFLVRCVGLPAGLFHFFFTVWFSLTSFLKLDYAELTLTEYIFKTAVEDETPLVFKF